MINKIYINQERLYDVSPFLHAFIEGLEDTGDEKDYRILSLNSTPINHEFDSGAAILTLSDDNYAVINQVLSLTQINRDTVITDGEVTVLSEYRGHTCYRAANKDGEIIFAGNVSDDEERTLVEKLKVNSLILSEHNKVGRDQFNWPALYFKTGFKHYFDIINGPDSKSIKATSAALASMGRSEVGEFGDPTFVPSEKFSNCVLRHTRLGMWLGCKKGKMWARRQSELLDTIDLRDLTFHQESMRQSYMWLTCALLQLSLLVDNKGYEEEDTDDE
jgi:hypothetical protein